MRGDKHMSAEFKDKQSLPWANRQTVLREIDWRESGGGIPKHSLPGLWKTGGKGVLALLHVESRLLNRGREESTLDPEKMS